MKDQAEGKVGWLYDGIYGWKSQDLNYFGAHFFAAIGLLLSRGFVGLRIVKVCKGNFIVFHADPKGERLFSTIPQGMPSHVQDEFGDHLFKNDRVAGKRVTCNVIDSCCL